MKRSVVLVAIAAAFALSACTSTPAPEQDAAPVAEQPTTTQQPVEVVTEVVTTTVTTAPPAQNAQKAVKVDNRLGYGDLKLGMTLEEARAAGLTDLTWDSPGDHTCVADDHVAISKKYGVVRITLPLDARTSRGIGVGSTFAEVKNAYQGASEYRAGWSARVDDKVRYFFVGGTGSGSGHFADTDRVDLIKIGSSDADCAMAYL